MKKFGFAALLLAFAVVAGNRAFGFSHDGMRPLSYSNVQTPYCGGCAMYCPSDAGCGPDIWADSSGCRHYRCYGNGGAPCSTCGTGTAGGAVINGAFTPNETTDGATPDGVMTGGAAAQPAQDRSADAAPVSAEPDAVRFSTPPAATTEKLETSVPPAAAKAEEAAASPPPASDLDESEDSDSASTDAPEKAASPADEDQSAKPQIDAESIKTLLDAAPADEK
jgi:hypothetical protein